MRRDLSKTRSPLATAAAIAALLGLTAGARPASAFVGGDDAVKEGKEAADAGVRVGTRVIRPVVVKGAAKRLPAALRRMEARLSVDAATGAPRLLTGKAMTERAALTGVTDPAAYEDVARDFIASAAEFLGVAADDLVLRSESTLIDDDVAFLKFDLRRDGLLVQDASIDVRFSHGRLVQVANLSFGEAAPDRRAPRAGLDRNAAAALGAREARHIDDLYRVDTDGAGYRLVRVARYDVEALDGEAFQVQVETATGKVFEIRPTKWRLNGLAAADVHARWYSEPLVPRELGEVTMPYAGGSVTTTPDGRYTGAPDTAQPRLEGFVGPRVRVALQTGTQVVAPGAPVRDEWHVVYRKTGSDAVTNDKNVAQSMVFYHTNGMIQHAKRYIQTPWFDQQLTANVNLGQTCNAHWDGSTINFYSGDTRCANTGLISDVVYHEWGHGLDAKTGGIEDGAYSEGFGDIMSLIMTRSNLLGIGFFIDGAGPVRDLEPDKVYPRDQGEVHAEGLIIGSTFWDLFKDLRDMHGEDAAADLLARYSLKTIFTASRYTDVYDALLVVDDDNGDLSDMTPNYCAINKNFAAHGLATADEACNLAALDAVRPVDADGGDGDGIIEPGETVELWVTARNASANPVAGLTGELTVRDVPGVTVTDSVISWDEIPARVPQISREPAAVAIDRGVACGTRFTATFNLKADPRTAVVATDLLVGRLVGTAATVSAGGLPKPIQDNQTTAVTMAFDGPQWGADTLVQAARLKFDATHSYQGDLEAWLVGPAGQRIRIWRGSGATDDVHFDADITPALAGIKGKGTWTLEIKDTAAQDTGTLEAAQLTMTPAAFECQ